MTRLAVAHRIALVAAASVAFALAGAGEYAMTDAREFARAVTRDLQAVSRDKHLRVFPGGDQRARQSLQAPANQGIGKHEILPGNVG